MYVANKIAFINGKGGCGKTTSIFHIAGVLSKAGERVLVIDFDKQRNTTDTLLMHSDRKERTIFDVMVDTRPEDATVEVLFQRRGNAKPRYHGVDGIASDIRLENEAMLSQVDADLFGIIMDDFIKRKQYTWVLVDMPPSNKAMNDICLGSIVDHLIIPMSSDVFSVSGYGDIMESTLRARQLNPGLNVLGIYLSRYMDNCSVDRYIRGQLQGYDTFIDVQIPMATDIREGVMFGRPISYYKEFSKSRRAYENLVAEIKKRIGALR